MTSEWRTTLVSNEGFPVTKGFAGLLLDTYSDVDTSQGESGRAGLSRRVVVSVTSIYKDLKPKRYIGATISAPDDTADSRPFDGLVRLATLDFSRMLARWYRAKSLVYALAREREVYTPVNSVVTQSRAVHRVRMALTMPVFDDGFLTLCHAYEHFCVYTDDPVDTRFTNDNFAFFEALHNFLRTVVRTAIMEETQLDGISTTAYFRVAADLPFWVTVSPDRKTVEFTYFVPEGQEYEL